MEKWRNGKKDKRVTEREMTKELVSTDVLLNKLLTNAK
jgi:hypothetical protein